MKQNVVPDIEPYMTDDVPLDDVRDNAMRPLIYICLLLTIGLVFLGFVVRVPEYVKTRFVLQGDVPEVEYQFPESVYMEEVRVTAGQRVQEGDGMIRITSPDIVEQIARLREAESELSRFQNEETGIQQSRLSQNELETTQVREQLNEHRRTLETENRTFDERVKALEFDVAEAEKQVEQNRPLVEQGFVSQTRYTQLQQEANRARDRLAEARQQHDNEVNRLEGMVRKLGLDMDMHRLERDRLIRTFTQKEQKLIQDRDQELASLRHKYRQADIVDGSLLLRAPISGTVSFLRAGERALPPGETLIKIMGEEQGLHAVAVVDAAQLGRLTVGQDVVLKLDSFPHYRFGVAKGTVSSVSLSPDAEGRLPFTVVITDSGNLDGRLRLGMGGRMAVVVARQRFFQMLFNKVQQQLDN